MKFLKSSNIRLITLILIIAVISFSFSTKASAFTVLTPQAIGYLIVGTIAIVSVMLATPNLLPCPSSVAAGQTTTLRAFFPFQNNLEYKLPEGFKVLSVDNKLLAKELVIKAPEKRGLYSYEKVIAGISLPYEMGVLSPEEVAGGVVNPTPKGYSRSPLLGGALQSVGSLIGLGYIYADEMSIEPSWPWQPIKSMIFTILASAAYSNGEARGLKYNENPGFYIGAGLITCTVYDVVKIINTKNSYSDNLSKKELN